MLTFVFCQLVVTQKSSLAFYRNMENQARVPVKNIAVLTDILGDGQKLSMNTVVNISGILNSKISSDKFSINRRSFTTLYSPYWRHRQAYIRL